MGPDSLLDHAKAVVGYGTALARAYGDQLVFPDRVQIDHGPDFECFPSWNGPDVLVLSHENQGVVTWGLDLTDGRVVVGGDLPTGPGTEVYVDDVETFARCREWDFRCLNTQPCLQAQASPLDEADLDRLNGEWTSGPVTRFWPCEANHRFER